VHRCAGCGAVPAEGGRAWQAPVSPAARVDEADHDFAAVRPLGRSAATARQAATAPGVRSETVAGLGIVSGGTGQRARTAPATADADASWFALVRKPITRRVLSELSGPSPLCAGFRLRAVA
jgi:hypothetical protein